MLNGISHHSHRVPARGTSVGHIRGLRDSFTTEHVTGDTILVTVPSGVLIVISAEHHVSRTLETPTPASLANGDRSGGDGERSVKVSVSNGAISLIRGTRDDRLILTTTVATPRILTHTTRGVSNGRRQHSGCIKRGYVAGSVGDRTRIAGETFQRISTSVRAVSITVSVISSASSGCAAVSGSTVTSAHSVWDRLSPYSYIPFSVSHPTPITTSTRTV